MKQWGGAQRLLSGIFGDPVDPERWAAENLLVLGEKLEASDLADLRIYLDCGDQDRYGFDKPNLELHGILEGRHIPHTWRLVEGGHHGWRANYNQQALPYSLRFVAEAWAHAKEASDHGGTPGATPEPHKSGSPGR
jgi:enterochelin esterase-like enzyme